MTKEHKVKEVSMSTGIFRTNPIGQLEEVPQKDIDFWCSQCQFPLRLGGCSTSELIQQCWDEGGAVAHKWHLQHECPFVHSGQSCRCNDFKNIRSAFRAAGLTYKS